jgi:hypothetical protein
MAVSVLGKPLYPYIVRVFNVTQMNIVRVTKHSAGLYTVSLVSVCQFGGVIPAIF